MKISERMANQKGFLEKLLPEGVGPGMVIGAAAGSAFGPLGAAAGGAAGKYIDDQDWF
jgi:hypothetical protein